MLLHPELRTKFIYLNLALGANLISTYRLLIQPVLCQPQKSVNVIGANEKYTFECLEKCHTVEVRLKPSREHQGLISFAAIKT